MRKILKTVACAGLCCCLVLPAAGCKKSGLDPESRPLQLATAALDGNFNPYTYTSMTDGDVLGMTQVGMFTNDAKGNLICGQNEASVALNYATTMYDKKSGGNITASGTADGRTEYEIVIKNGIKFSDGVDLTIKDVLFNLYVYLDVAYTGSSTIYSTDIQGLNAYRAQDPTLTDESDSDVSATFNSAALERVYAILDWLDNSPSNEIEPTDAQIKADLETTKKLFREEIESDWTSIESSWADDFKEYNFTAAWQAYLFNEGIAWVQTRLNPTTNSAEQIKDANGKFVTTLEPNVAGANNVTGATGEIHLQDYIDLLNAATTDDKVSAYATEHNCTTEYALLQLQKEYCLEVVYENFTEKSQIGNVLQYWATATSAMQEFAAQERTKYYNDLREQGIKVDSISGITTYKATGAELKASNKGWKMTGETFNDGENYSVLKVVINGIDPKAIYNLAFSVSPLHYYSGEWTNPVTGEKKDYVKAAMEDTENKEFGVQVGNSTFFSDVLNSTKKNGLPVGAGPYMASTQYGGTATDRNEFYTNNTVFYERNAYFETMGTGIENAKIKFLRYHVTSDDRIMSLLVSKDLDYGTPNAINENLNTVTQTKHLKDIQYREGGYGYVGINPKFVPELEVRQAIMKAMNTNLIMQNYYKGLAEPINRPMTKESWAYPNAAEDYQPTKYTTNDQEIIDLVEKAGYRKGSDGIYAKNGKKLKITFTIAGSSSDHPALQMFNMARDRLNTIGFDISVSNSSTALRDMTRGNLAVWAAAWSSAIDPDPYQVYHKDSKATSVNNWNYPEILKPSNTQFSRERGIIEQLSLKIDEGRSYLEQEDRIPVYAECLDLIMQLAVELPTYQRRQLCVYNLEVLDASTINQSASAYDGPISDIWKLNYVK